MGHQISQKFLCSRLALDALAWATSPLLLWAKFAPFLADSDLSPAHLPAPPPLPVTSPPPRLTSTQINLLSVPLKK